MQTRGNNRSKTIKEINAGITFFKNPESKKVNDEIRIDKYTY